MRLILIAGLALGVISTVAAAQSTTTVQGHVRKDGTYVPPHVRTNPNSTRNDNWSTKGNTNPYNGRQGTKEGGQNTGRKSTGWGY